MRYFDVRLLLPELPHSVTPAGHDPAVLAAVGLAEAPVGQQADLAWMAGELPPAQEARWVMWRPLVPPRTGQLRFAVLPSALAPRIVIDLRQRGAMRYLLAERLSAGTGPVPRIKAGLKATLLRRGRLPGWESVVATGPRGGPPRAVEAAVSAGLVSRDHEWFAVLDPGPPSKRVAFLVLEDGTPHPSAAILMARQPRYRAPFDREEQGLAAAAAAGLAERAPRLRGRLLIDDHHASVADAAPGAPLDLLLVEGGGRARRVVEDVGRWLVDVAKRREPGARLGVAERRHLEQLGSGGLDLARVPAVGSHGDLNTSNVIAAPQGWLVIDWEQATMAGPPLWDVIYFAAHALPLLDGARTAADVEAHLARLFLGQAPSSPLLFGWVRAAVAAAGLPPEDVGPLAALCWRHHVALLAERAAAGGSRTDAPAIASQAAHVWAREPRLGHHWMAWQQVGQ